jgi:ABC-type dipeptide/oligopeptide/nickel transport system permease subunit
MIREAAAQTKAPSASMRSPALRRLGREPLAASSAALIALLLLVALLAPAIAPYAYDAQDRAYAQLPAPPDAHHWLGTDDLGQDILSRLIYGARASLTISAVVLGLQTVIGVAIGLLAASIGGWIDALVMHLTDAVMAFPDLLFVIAVAGVVRPATPLTSFLTLFVALALISWPAMARLVRAQALELREREFILAARAQGLTGWRIATRYLLPNLLTPIIVNITVSAAGVILAESALSFLGIGIQPPYPSWGRMISDARPYMRFAPLLLVCPASMLSLTILAFNFLGDALRDALDPRKRF